MTTIGRKERVPIRTAWPDEARDFTPWLASTHGLEELGYACGLRLVNSQTEVPALNRRTDIVCVSLKDGFRPVKVVVENQLDTLDPDHLARAELCADTLHAGICIMVATDFTSDVIRHVVQRNNITDRRVDFYCVRVSAYSVDGGKPFPELRIVVRPFRRVRAALRTTTFPRVILPVNYASDQVSNANARGESDTIERFFDILVGELRKLGRQTPVRGKKPGYRRFDIEDAPASYSVIRDGRSVRLRLFMAGKRYRDWYRRLEESQLAINSELCPTESCEAPGWSGPAGGHCSIEVKRDSDLANQLTWNDDFRWVIAKLDLFKKVFTWRLDNLRNGYPVVH